MLLPRLSSQNQRDQLTLPHLAQNPICSRKNSNRNLKNPSHEIQMESKVAKREIEICSSSKPHAQCLTLGLESGRCIAPSRNPTLASGDIIGTNGLSMSSGFRQCRLRLLSMLRSPPRATASTNTFPSWSEHTNPDCSSSTT